jgi:DNA uptake protein ComE-like DNA-binding protein
MTMNWQSCQISSLLASITSDKEAKILRRLNSLNTADEIINALSTYTRQEVFGYNLALRIVKIKREMGGFQNIRQIASVPGVGAKRFTAIINALNSEV